MVQKGDTVRYLSAVGGGIVTRVEGRIAYVDDDGFETPVQASELVVVIPAGHQQDRPGKMMFDQKAFDTGRTDERSVATPKYPESDTEQHVEDFPIEETEYGDDMTVVLIFEPKNVKKLSSEPITVGLVNDSNYFLGYQFLCRPDDNGWKVFARGEAAPNELVDITKLGQSELSQLERIVFQAIAYKRDKTFEFKTPMSVSKKIDVTKFFKMHCFRPGTYSDNPSLEIPLVIEHPRPRNLKPKTK